MKVYSSLTFQKFRGNRLRMTHHSVAARTQAICTLLSSMVNFYSFGHLMLQDECWKFGAPAIMPRFQSSGKEKGTNFSSSPTSFKISSQALVVGVAQLVRVLSVGQKVRGLIPSQGTCLGCKFDSWLGCIRGGSLSMFFSSIKVSLSFSLFSSFFKNNEKMSSGEA